MSLDKDPSSASSATIEAVAPDAGSKPPSESRWPRYEMKTWDISELLSEPSEDLIGCELDKLEQAVVAFEGRREELDAAMEPADFLAIMREFERLENQSHVLSGYAHLWFCSNTQSSPAVGFRNRVRQVLTRLHNRMLFFELWWQSLEDDEAERLLPAAGPGDHESDFRHFLLELRRFKPHTLDERSEQIINIKNNNGIDAVLTLYSMLANRLEFQLEIEGETQTLTDGEMRGLFFDPDPDLRVAVNREMFGVYERESKVLAQIYATRVRDWYTEHVEIRGFPSPISVRNLYNDIPDSAVETLLSVVRDNAPLFHHYFQLKAKYLGTETLRRYDLYAPLATSSRTLSFSAAADQVLETFDAFDPRFAELAGRVLAEDHVDSEIRKGKRSGAFCCTVRPENTPWVLVNYTGRMRDVATLAHELGHAVHSQLANRHSVLTQHPSLPLAETASVFSEMLMTDRLLAQESDPVTRRELLAAAIDDVYATVMRQTYFVRFELAAHEAIRANKSADELFELYYDQLREQFADSVDVTPEFRYEWVSIPHLFNTPFYCYAYSFGQLLVLALYRRYQQQGDAFKPGYFRLLSYGGSARPAEMLAEIDIDIDDAAFWQGGFDVVRDMIGELEATDRP